MADMSAKNGRAKKPGGRRELRPLSPAQRRHCGGGVLGLGACADDDDPTANSSPADSA